MWAFRQAVGLSAISFFAPQAPLKKDAAPIPNANRYYEIITSLNKKGRIQYALIIVDKVC